MNNKKITSIGAPSNSGHGESRTPSVVEILSTLVQNLNSSKLRKLSVIPWAAPVVSFGDLSQSRVATLGLNPSNREFVDVDGNELDGTHRRFHTLSSLGIKSWSHVTAEHLELILDSCSNYFVGNPYDLWFQALDRLIIGSNVSYYGLFSKACHLDLVPYATSCKWVELTGLQRDELLQSGGDALGALLRVSSVDVLIVNGQSVIENLQKISQSTFEKISVPEWTLPRRSSMGVKGYAYKGKIDIVSGISLGREIAVLGFSHNIQSSYGVTGQVKNSIQQWITSSSNEVFG